MTTPPALDYTALLRAPHVLICGTTGSGKSVIVNGILREMLKNRACTAFLIDPKKIELSAYRQARAIIGYTQTPAGAVRLLEKSAAVMAWTYRQMEKKNLKLSEYADHYIIIDELADVMLSPEKKAFCASLQKVLQLGRAARVHVIAATQQPSRRCLPAEIVDNFTDRVALRCLSPIESRQIIGVPGAELLPRYGQALVLSSEGLQRYTVPNCTPEEVREALQAAPRRLFRVRKA